jgi:hypothetical protein
MEVETSLNGYTKEEDSKQKTMEMEVRSTGTPWQRTASRRPRGWRPAPSGTPVVEDNKQKAIEVEAD